MARIGFAVTGSFCSMDDMLYVLENLSQEHDIEVFMTPHVDMMDTRFYQAKEMKEKVKKIINKEIHTSIQDAEKYGPLEKLGAVVVYPCDATTLAKLYYGINDNGVTMLVKSCLRNQVPIVLGVYSNDVLSITGHNLFGLMRCKHYYFVPMYQDDYQKKPNSLIACKEKVKETLECALKHQQYQPFLLGCTKYKSIRE